MLNNFNKLNFFEEEDDQKTFRNLCFVQLNIQDIRLIMSKEDITTYF